MQTSFSHKTVQNKPSSPASNTHVDAGTRQESKKETFSPNQAKKIGVVVGVTHIEEGKDKGKSFQSAGQNCW